MPSTYRSGRTGGDRRTHTHVPTEERRAYVRSLAGRGVNHNDICAMLQITAPTLYRHYRHDLDRGRIEANLAMADSLHWMGTKGRDSRAAIFWLKTRAGWKETAVVEHTGQNGGPIQSLNVVLDPIEAARAYQRMMSGEG